MPSSEIIEIDLEDNDADVIDTSSRTVRASTVTQSQQDENGTGVTLSLAPTFSSSKVKPTSETPAHFSMFESSTAGREKRPAGSYLVVDVDADVAPTSKPGPDGAVGIEEGGANDAEEIIRTETATGDPALTGPVGTVDGTGPAPAAAVSTRRCTKRTSVGRAVAEGGAGASEKKATTTKKRRRRLAATDDEVDAGGGGELDSEEAGKTAIYGNDRTDVPPGRGDVNGDGDKAVVTPTPGTSPKRTPSKTKVQSAGKSVANKPRLTLDSFFKRDGGSGRKKSGAAKPFVGGVKRPLGANSEEKFPSPSSTSASPSTTSAGMEGRSAEKAVGGAVRAESKGSAPSNATYRAAATSVEGDGAGSTAARVPTVPSLFRKLAPAPPALPLPLPLSSSANVATETAEANPSGSLGDDGNGTERGKGGDEKVPDFAVPLNQVNGAAEERQVLKGADRGKDDGDDDVVDALPSMKGGEEDKKRKEFEKSPVIDLTGSHPEEKTDDSRDSNPARRKERENLLRRHAALRKRHVHRALELAERPSWKDFEEEMLDLEASLAEREEIAGSATLPSEKGCRVEVTGEGEFPDGLVPHLAVLVQGSPLSLPSLAKVAHKRLSNYVDPAGRYLTAEAVSSKIKLLAQRKQYLAGHPRPAPFAAAEGGSAVAAVVATNKKVDRFENVDEYYAWRWELVSIDLLSPLDVGRVKKARSVRKKLQGHHRAVLRLISVIDDASGWLRGGGSCVSGSVTSSSSNNDYLAKISDAEEKVLKFEREEENARLLHEAKLKKEGAKADEKEHAEEVRRTEKKRREEEKELKKIEAAREREEVKQKRVEEKEDLRRKKEEEKEQLRRKKEEEKMTQLKEQEGKEKKRKARMMSFFSKPCSKGDRRKGDAAAAVTVRRDGSAATPAAVAETDDFDGDKFHSMIGSLSEHALTNPFANPSARSRASRQRKTTTVNVSVSVTVLPENPFAQQPYDEEKIVAVPNRYKFLGFHEDHRAPYHGTWSKPHSSIVTGRTPFGKDTQYLDYDVDSEAEWEEEDDEQGEDCDDDGPDDEEEKQIQEEEGDATVYNFDDGWLAEDDDLGIEDEDDDTKELRKKKLHLATSSGPTHSTHCTVGIIAPRMGGVPHDDCAAEEMERLVEGINPQDAMDMISSHTSFVFTPPSSCAGGIYLEAFLPPDNAEGGVGPSRKNPTNGKQPSSAGGESKNSTSLRMSPGAARTMAKFVHNCTLKSRDLIVTELRKAHPAVTNSRAHARRELDAIVEKRRLPNGGGVVWEVKKDRLDTLGLKTEQLNTPPAVPAEVALALKEEPKVELSKTADADKSSDGGATGTNNKALNKPQMKKRTKSDVSVASANLFASFLKKKRKMA